LFLRLEQLTLFHGTGSCFPGYCTGSCTIDVRSSTRHSQLTEYRGFALFCTLHPCNLPPNQVRFALRSIGLPFGFLQTQPLASDALAIQMVIPSVGGDFHLLSGGRVCRLAGAKTNKNPAKGGVLYLGADE